MRIEGEKDGNELQAFVASHPFVRMKTKGWDKELWSGDDYTTLSSRSRNA